MKHVLALCSLFVLVLPLVILAQTGPAPSITIKWNAVTAMSDGKPVPSNVSVSYNLYGGHSLKGPWAAPVKILGTSTTRNGVALGSDCYYLTSVVNGKESLPTTPQCVTVAAAAPSTVPAKPTNVTVTINAPH